MSSPETKQSQQPQEIFLSRQDADINLGKIGLVTAKMLAELRDENRAQINLDILAKFKGILPQSDDDNPLSSLSITVNVIHKIYCKYFMDVRDRTIKQPDPENFDTALLCFYTGINHVNYNLLLAEKISAKGYAGKIETDHIALREDLRIDPSGSIIINKLINDLKHQSDETEQNELENNSALKVMLAGAKFARSLYKELHPMAENLKPVDRSKLN